MDNNAFVRDIFTKRWFSSSLIFSLLGGKRGQIANLWGHLCTKMKVPRGIGVSERMR